MKMKHKALNTTGWYDPGSFPKSNGEKLAHSGQIPPLKIKRRKKKQNMYTRPAISANPIV